MYKMRVLLVALLFSPIMYGGMFGNPAYVDDFTPSGSVKRVKQVKVRFSEEVTHISMPINIEPFHIECPVNGTGRWIDGSNWLYDFDKELEAGITCKFTVRGDLFTLEGNMFQGVRTFTFSTGPPIVKSTVPYNGSLRVKEDQIFILNLDGEIDESSIVDNVYFLVEGFNEKVGIKLIKGEDREKILKAHYGNNYKSKKDLKVLIQSLRTFPSGKKLQLVWGKGIRSKSGIVSETEQVLKYKIQKPFRASFSCTTLTPKDGCVPLNPMYVSFSSYFPVKMIKDIKLHGPKKTYPAKVDYEYYGYTDSVVFKGPFPESTEFTIELPENLSDDGGRTLENLKNFPMKVSTDSYPPLVKFPSRFGILESKEALLPVTFRGVEPSMLARVVEMPTCPDCPKEDGGIVGWIKKKLGRTQGQIHRVEDKRQILKWLTKVAGSGRSRSLLKQNMDARQFIIDRPGDPKDFEVVGIPLKEPGFYVVELESPILGKKLLGSSNSMYILTSALVTNLSAHFKWGPQSSLVWVTTLDDAKPVEGATVTIMDCRGKVHWISRTGPDGVAQINNLPRQDKTPWCDIGRDDEAFLDYTQLTPVDSTNTGLFVVVNTDNDMTFVHSSWNEGIEPWQFNMPTGNFSGDHIVHTVFGRNLLRAGQTINMKHIMRGLTTEGFSLLNSHKHPKKLVINHYGSGQKYEQLLDWDLLSGTAESQWKIPVDAKLGSYGVSLVKPKSTFNKYDKYYYSGYFRVEEFRVPLLKATMGVVDGPVVGKSQFDMDVQVNYLAGGGAEGLPVKLRSLAKKKNVLFSDYDGYVFANGEIVEGIKSGYGQSLTDESKVTTYEHALQEGGALRADISNIGKNAYPQDVLVELEFRDPNGEVQTVSRTVPVWPSDIVLGIKPDSWLLSKDSLKFYIAALDVTGKPLSGIKVESELFTKKTFSHRRRIIGGFYTYEHKREIKRAGTLCNGVTDKRGLVVCETSSPVAGEVIVQAKTIDDDGRVSSVNKQIWLGSEDDFWFDVKDTDRISILPEKNRYNPGENARIQIKMPFREATALITVEREGILDTRVFVLNGREPTFTVPIKDNYGPNVFVSALVVRGRVGDVKPTSMIDLGKPAYKLGVCNLNVGWSGHELKVTVKADKKSYKVRSKARVNIKVERADGKPLTEKGQLAVAAVDAGLLELSPNDSWDILKAMMAKRPLSVYTSTAQMQVVGRRHYGLKGQPAGGGGGKAVTRELFDTLLLWKGIVPFDETGLASIEVPLNDSLTAFKIAAIANAGKGLFGTGVNEIKTTQDIMLFSGLPQVVREGDKFSAVFTVRNSSGEQKKIAVRAQVKAGNEDFELPTVLKKDLRPGEANEVQWLFTVPEGSGNIAWTVSAFDGNTWALKDKLRVKQDVTPSVPVRVYQATLWQLEDDHKVKVKRPDGAKNGVGGIKVYFKSSIANQTDGIVKYMSSYPYNCMEQKVSKAIALNNKKMWRRIINDMPAYLDKKGFLKYFPTQTHGSDVLTSYVLSISNEAGFEIPFDIKNKLEGALQNFAQGKFIPDTQWHLPDLSIRKMAAIEALSRSKKVTNKMIDSIVLSPLVWPTSGLLDWLGTLKRTKSINKRDYHLKNSLELFRSGLIFQGTELHFYVDDRNELWWLMTSSETNAVKSITTLLGFDSWKEDLPKILKGALGRQRNGRWRTTVTNAWGVVALRKFAEKFESDRVNGLTTVSLDDQVKELSWDSAKNGGAVFFDWPDEASSLNIKHNGAGKPWVMVQSLAAIPLKDPLSIGFKIKKTILPVSQKTPDKWSLGDVARVSIEVEAQNAMGWVAINDPVPSGSTILGSGLARDSAILTKDEKNSVFTRPTYVERTFSSFIAYYEFVPYGKWTVEYTVRLNNEGEFMLPPTMVEALYAPEMFGALPNEKFVVHK